MKTDTNTGLEAAPKTDLETDIAIVGGGPAGLCLARALSGAGLDITVFDGASSDELAEPAPDGREIALTHVSMQRLERLGIWSGIDPESISPLRDAAVYDGDSTEPMRITRRDGGRDRLGSLVSNFRIRRAAWQALAGVDDLRVETDTRVEAVDHTPERRRLVLSDGRVVGAELVVAADSRFSGVRRAAGIGARMRDFGRSMVLAPVCLEIDHEHVAWEWFGYDRNLALLPLNDGRASCVITLAHERARWLSEVDDASFNRELNELYQGRLGRMRLDGDRYLYPLVGVWPDRLIADRLVAVGDAAVGMHPVTAHGFNLGLAGVDVLAEEIFKARSRGRDFFGRPVLAAYERRHRLASLPLYFATQTLVGLYSDDRLPARLLRRSALRLADRFAPFREVVARQLTGEGGLPGPRSLLRGRAR